MRFEKVSRAAFLSDLYNAIPKFDMNVAEYLYDELRLPSRGTRYSAGYDICTPVGFVLHPDEKISIPTGIKAVFNEDEMDTWHLQMYVRSSIGIKCGVVLMNGTGIIDPDYQFAGNEGDMMLALWNTSDKPVFFKAGDRVCQGVFAIHGRTSDDKACGERTGGVGSTGK